jgi:hypothetical protein
MNTTTTQGIEFTRANSDMYGNPRYIIHFREFLTYEETTANERNFLELYDVACKRANKLGGRKYTGRNYGGGIVLQSYNIEETARRIQELIASI